MSLAERQAVELPDRRIVWPEIMDTALTMPGRMTDTYCRLRDYSYGNMVLLMMQGVMEPVAGYKHWPTLGRHVKAGARGKVILHPLIKKVVNKDGEERRAVIGFKPRRSVFAYSDTEGEPLPEVQPREWSRERALASLAIRETAFQSLNHNAQGYSTGNELAINPVAKYPFKTTIHEIGHVVLGHTAPDELAEYQTHRGLKEFEAEGTAYLVMNELDLPEAWDAAESRAYIQTWLHGETPPDQSIKRVFAAATKILQAGRVALTDTEGGEEE